MIGNKTFERSFNSKNTLVSTLNNLFISYAISTSIFTRNPMHVIPYPCQALAAGQNETFGITQPAFLRFIVALA